MEELRKTDTNENYRFANKMLFVKIKLSLKRNLKLIKKYFQLFAQRITNTSRNKSYPLVNFVIENANWSIKWDGIYLRKYLHNNTTGQTLDISKIPIINSTKRVIHFGSQYMWEEWSNILPKDNKYVVSFFHGKYEDGPKASKHIDEFIKTQNSIYKVVTGSSIIFDRLKNWGIPASKLICIPIGVDTRLFKIPTKEEKEKIREKLGFEKHEIIIGSFQKDGVGWSDGDIPKFIKGPDLLVESLDLISKEFPIKVLLTGPARGYVKNELSKRNIKYKHVFLNSYEEIANYYHALDLYLVSSREEGGPKAIVESMASGVPLVTTNVGMAKDFVKDQINGGLVNEFDSTSISKKIVQIINNPYKANIIKKAREEVMRADWEIVAQTHWEKVYKPAIKELNENINFYNY